MYKPNFCSECGSRIERSGWHLWTSRKFCTHCAPRFRRTQIFLPVAAGTILFGTGLLAGRGVNPSSPPPLTVERGELPVVVAPVKKEGKDVESDARDRQAPKPEPSYGPDGTSTERPTDPEEVVAICGARTKNGTPCQRRVRGTGRCWQHRGMPAMIPLEKRIITGT